MANKNDLLTGIILQVGVSTNWKNISQIWSLTKQGGNNNLKKKIIRTTTYLEDHPS